MIVISQESQHDQQNLDSCFGIGRSADRLRQEGRHLEPRRLGTVDHGTGTYDPRTHGAYARSGQLEHHDSGHLDHAGIVGRLISFSGEPRQT